MQLHGPVLAVLIVVAAVQVALQIAALVVLARTPAERLVFAAKWPWVLIILLTNLVGPVVFFAAARRPAPADWQHPTADAAGRADTGRVVDSLYGDDR